MKLTDRLAALAVSRRAAVVSIWRGLDLLHTRHLQLNSQENRSIGSLTRLFLDSLERFGFTTVALELPADLSTRTGRLVSHIRKVCRDNLVSLVEVDKDTLRKESWVVPFRTRAQLRSSALTLWPVLTDSKLRQLTCDSTLLGLFAQSKRLIHFSLNQ